MANMSYCRFRNTLYDLEDCLCSIDEACDGGDKISKEECAAGNSLFREFLRYCKDTGIIDDYDRDVLDCMFDNAGGESNE